MHAARALRARARAARARPAQPFNDANREERARYAPLAECTHAVELVPRGRAPGADSLAAAIAARPEREWRRALAVPFLDSAASPSLTRALYVPWLSARKNRWADYVLYERR